MRFMEYNRIADIKRLQFIREVLKEHFPNNAEVLDVGCGNGIIARGVGDAGYSVKGIDVSAKTIEKARELTDNPRVTFDVISAEDLAATGKKFQAVICSEVLEHLHHPGQLLETLYHSLANDGILIVTVPNGRGPRELFVTRPMIKLQQKETLSGPVNKVKKLLGYRGTTVQSDADDLTHVQFFSKSDLYALAKQHDFRIIRFGVTNFADDVFPFSMLARRSTKLQKMDAALANRIPHEYAGSFISVWQKL